MFFILQIYFKFNTFASLLIYKIYKMKKLMSIFGVMLFAFALTLTSCGDSASTDSEVTVCSNTGEACLDDHSCCAVEEGTHIHGEEEHSHVGGGEEHSHDEVTHSHGEEEHSHEGGNEEHTH